MSRFIEMAQRNLDMAFEAENPGDLAKVHIQAAIAMALIAIAEQLDKIAEIGEFTDAGQDRLETLRELEEAS